MLVEILHCTGGDIYIPMDGPWNSDQDNAAFAEAERLFEEMKLKHDYVALIQSHSDYSHGYWIELKRNGIKQKANFPDHILKEYEKPRS